MNELQIMCLLCKFGINRKNAKQIVMKLYPLFFRKLLYERELPETNGTGLHMRLGNRGTAAERSAECPVATQLLRT